MSANDEQLIVLREIRDSLRTLVEALNSPRLCREDHDVLTRLLPALGGRFGSKNFTVKEIMRDAIFSVLTGEMNSRELGNLLRRAADQNIEGYRVQRVGREHSAAFWMVVRVV